MSGAGAPDIPEIYEQAAARELGVHRHTIRNRLARAQSLLSASLDNPDTRAELWLALRLSGHC